VSSAWRSAKAKLLAPFLRKFALVFFDDRKSEVDHTEHLALVFQVLRDNRLSEKGEMYFWTKIS
jgi:hypothetical protein